MVKFNEKIQQSDLPTIANNFFPNPAWSGSNSFDYKQYYDKKKGLRTFQHARSLDQSASCKADENFKIYTSNTGPTQKQFYNFTDYKTRMNVSKYYYLIHPYCELNDSGSQIFGNDLYDNTIGIEGIAGRNSTTPYTDGTNDTSQLTPTVQNQIKGALPYDQCINFKNGFKPDEPYKFNL
jgi:hypothetical protein